MCSFVYVPTNSKPFIGNSTMIVTSVFFYPKLIGKPLHASKYTRHDNITAYVNELSRHMLAPTTRHRSQAKQHLRYVQREIDLGLTFNGKNRIFLQRGKDSSFANGPKIHIRTRFVALICGAQVIWGKKLQHIIALITIDAEYMLLCATSQ